MKATGIVRKIDDLGRIVIPKEIRKSLRIREGDPLEIYIENDGEIFWSILATMGDMLDVATQYAETLNRTTDFIVCVTDTETIVTVSGAPKKEYIAKEISEHVLNVMEDRAIWSTKDDRIMPIIIGDSILKYRSQIIAPIICDGDAVGTVIMFSLDYDKPITNVEYKLVQNAANFLASQMET